MMLKIEIQSWQRTGLIECSSNYSETTERLWFCSKDEATNFNRNIADTNNFKSFICKPKL